MLVGIRRTTMSLTSIENALQETIVKETVARSIQFLISEEMRLETGTQRIHLGNISRQIQDRKFVVSHLSDIQNPVLFLI